MKKIDVRCYSDSLGIAPTQTCTHFLKIGFVVAGAGFITFISTKGVNQIKKENCKKKSSFMHTKRFNTFFKRWVPFRVGAIPRLLLLYL